MRFYVGQNDYCIKEITEEDVLAFAELSGDKNPVHINKQIAEASIFHGQVAHGMYTASLISKVIGMQMPGEGTIYISQNCRFKKPVYIGDVVKATVEILSIQDNKRACLSTKVYNQKDELVMDGSAEVLLPKE